MMHLYKLLCFNKINSASVRIRDFFQKYNICTTLKIFFFAHLIYLFIYFLHIYSKSLCSTYSLYLHCAPVECFGPSFAGIRLMRAQSWRWDTMTSLLWRTITAPWPSRYSLSLTATSLSTLIPKPSNRFVRCASGL